MGGSCGWSARGWPRGSSGTGRGGGAARSGLPAAGAGAGAAGQRVPAPRLRTGGPAGGGNATRSQLKRRRHQPIPAQGRWLASVLHGHMASYAVPGNTPAVKAFRDQATRHWWQVLWRRSQKTRVTWQRMRRTATRWLPPA